MYSLVRKSRAYFALLTAAAFALRAFFVIKFAVFNGDGPFYGELAKNWLQHGILGTTEANAIVPSWIRLPGYPAFLAGVWAITGAEHYRAVMIVQMFVDVATCFIIADLARRTLRSDRAAKLAFLVAALCPFTANFVSNILTETLAIFFAALALDLAVMALDSGRLSHWATCGTALACGILLRPDGGILLAAIGGYLGVRLILNAQQRRDIFLAGVIVSAVALAPLVPWTVRNWRDFHQFQPLAPRYANAPYEFVPRGLQRWVRTWMADYTSVAEFYWAYGERPFDSSKLPSRAFDSAEERAQVEQLFTDYNIHDLSWTPALDSELAKIADARIHRAPFRYYVWLPALRIADMWFRPRTDTVGLDDHWWDVAGNTGDSLKSIALAGLNLLYIAGAVYALLTRSWGKYWAMPLAFVVARSLFLGTLENPEPRYTLECFPAVILFAAAIARRARAFNTQDEVRTSPLARTAHPRSR